jgi:hypothetical protein
VLQDIGLGTPLLSLLQIVYLSRILIAVLENVSPTQGYRKKATFSTLIVGPVGTGNPTRATCVSGWGATVMPSTRTRSWRSVGVGNTV